MLNISQFYFIQTKEHFPSSSSFIALSQICRKKIYKVEQRDGINKFNLFNMLINFRTPHKFDIYQQWSEITQELNIFGLRNFIQKPYSCLFTRGEWFLPSDFSYKSAKSNKQQKKLWRRDKTGSLLMHPAKSFFLSWWMKGNV